MAENSALIYPMLAVMFLTFGVGMWLAISRTLYALSGKISEEEFALSSEAWPLQIQKISNNFNNLFQVPIFFFIVCLLIMQNQMVDSSLVILAWVFAASRVVHSIIHTSYNNVMHRFMAYLVGVFSNIFMVIYFALKISGAI